MSGAGWVRKHDVYTRHELIECKATRAASYSLKLELLEEVERAGLMAGGRGLLDIKYEPQGKRPRRFVVLPEEEYLHLSRSAGER
jgi:hypothetical protein